jgi:uncharacterized protein
MYTEPRFTLFPYFLGCCLVTPFSGWAEPSIGVQAYADNESRVALAKTRAVTNKVGNQVTERAERIATLEDSLRAKMDEMRSLDEDPARRPRQQKDIQLTPSDLRSIRDQAAAGDAQAQNVLGEMYAVGEDVPQDSDKSREWFEKASAKNYAKAQYNLGMQYTDDTDGYVTSSDYMKARELWEQAAGQGYTRAQSALGWLYSGIRAGVPPDYAKARQWYERAAAQGDAYAQTRLGLMYEHGRGVPQDFAKARAWYEKAAAQGDPRAMIYLGLQHAYGLIDPPDLVKARQWFETAAAQGDPMAQTFLADLYAKESGIVPQDSVRAYMWYSLAAAEDQTAKDKYGAKYNRDVMARSLTSAQLAEAERLLRQCHTQQFKGC